MRGEEEWKGEEEGGRGEEWLRRKKRRKGTVGAYTK